VNSNWATADLCDDHEDALEILAPVFRDFGDSRAFYGQVFCIKVYEDNTLVARTLEQPGAGRVLVVDGGGSIRCALLGDRLGDMAVRNDWAGIVVYGCVRDSEQLAKLPIGIKALASMPRKSKKRGEGILDVSLDLPGARVTPGQWLYADADGIVIAAENLLSQIL